jgi:valyl-tRNA synthetase
MIARWPLAQPEEGWEVDKVSAFGVVQDIVRTIRNMRTEKKVTPGKKIPAIIAAGDRLAIIEGQRGTIAALAHLDPDELTLTDRLSEKPQGAASAVVSGVEIYLPLSDLVDPEAERARLQKDLSEVEGQIERLEKLLSGNFAEKAPAAVVDKERQKLAAYHDTAARLREQLGRADQYNHRYRPPGIRPIRGVLPARRARTGGGDEAQHRAVGARQTRKRLHAPLLDCHPRRTGAGIELLVLFL